MTPTNIAIVGAGWSGLAAAVQAVDAGHSVQLFEASRSLGGRSRGVATTLPDGTELMLDNGQHILIGAYRETLTLLRRVGVDPAAALLRLPLNLRFPNGSGLALPLMPPPWDALAGILGARGWSLSARASLLRAALGWQIRGFRCDDGLTVDQLCTGVHVQARQELIDPLCVAALNTPAQTASASVFLRVVRDSLFDAPGSSNLLLPRVDLTALFPAAAANWLSQRGTAIRLGARVQQLERTLAGWRLEGEGLSPHMFERVILATAASDAVGIVQRSMGAMPQALRPSVQTWLDAAQTLHFESIVTVYGHEAGARLWQPMLALRSDARHPAQFAFDRGQLGGPGGLMALVISASQGKREALQQQALDQARCQLGLNLTPVRSFAEKRATFACTAALRRPPMNIAPGLRACGDYVQGPYPATLEGAVRNGLMAADAGLA